MKLISVVGAAPLFAQFATAMQETACDHTTTAITYFADTNCQDIDHEMTQQEQLRMVTNGEGSMLDGTCHDVLDDDAAPSFAGQAGRSKLCEVYLHGLHVLGGMVFWGELRTHKPIRRLVGHVGRVYGHWRGVFHGDEIEAT